MPLTKDEICELQEKLLLLYKFIYQTKRFKEFYYQGIEINQKYEDDKGLISELIIMDGTEELLKSCILELEEMKKEKNVTREAEMKHDEKFQEILSSQDWNFLYKLYGMKNLDDIDKLDLELLLKII
jgi:hypothetical protein